MGRHTSKLAEITGFSLSDGIAYGKLNGIFFNATINDMNGISVITCFIKRDAGINLAGINSFLEANKKKYKRLRAAFEGPAVVITVPNFAKLNAQLLSELINELSWYLEENQYYSSGCSNCGSDDNPGYTQQGGRIREICSGCHELLSSEMSDIKQERKTGGSYLSGTIGAILGGIIGIIPWVLISLVGFVASISGLIMSLLAHRFYILLGGKRGRMMLLIIVVVVIIFTYAAVIVNQTITDYRYLVEIGYTDISVIRLFVFELGLPFDMSEDVGYLWGQLALGWLFAALGSFSVLRDVHKAGVGKDLEVKRLGSP